MAGIENSLAHTLVTSSELSDIVRNINLDDTTSSSDAGDVLIRSTGIVFPNRSCEAQRYESASSISNKADTVTITVKKLRDAPTPQPSTSDNQTKMEKLRQPKQHQKPHVPPPLRANLPAASVSHSGTKELKDKGATKPGPRPRKENKVPTEPEDPVKDGKGIPARNTSGQPKDCGSGQGRDLLISRYAAGGRGAVLAALKQRSQNAPLRREVKVQLLNPGPWPVPAPIAGQAEPSGPSQGPVGSSQGPSGPSQGPVGSSQGPVGPSGPSEILAEPHSVPPLPRGEPGDAANTAAVVTAAAIAATAPLIKAQSDMEVRVSQVTESLRRLLEAERERQAGSGAQEGAGRGTSGDRTSERVAQLEQQLSALTQHRIQQLELIQNQQIQLQSHLLGSALRMVTGSAPVTSAPVVNSDLSGHPVESNSQSTQQPDILRITHLDTVDVSTVGTNTDPTSQQRERGCIKSPLETPAPRRTVPKPSSGSSRWATGSQTARPPTSSSKPRRTPQGNGRLLEAILSNRHRAATGATAVETEEVAIATPSDDRQPEQTRSDQHQQEAPSVSTATQPPTGSHLQASANPSEAAARRANEMLREMGRLKMEMQTLLTTQEPFPALETVEPAKTRPVKPNPSSIFSPRPRYSPAVSPEERAPPSSTTTSSHLPGPPLAPPSTTTTTSSRLPGPSPPALSSVSMLEQTVSATGPVTSQPLAQPQPILLQRRPAVPSMFEEAGRVLRQVQRQRKVLEENLETMLRAKDGEVLHCQLEALSNNRVSTEEVRVKKTVDAWISTLSKDIQVEVAQEDFAASQRSTKANDTSTKGVTKSQDAPPVLRQKASGGRDTARSGEVKGRPLSTLRGPGSKMVVRGSRGLADKRGGQTDKLSKPTGQRRPGQAQPQSESLRTETEGGKEGERGEAYLMRLYGKALYEGHRRTLKKSPYLRFSSPASPRTKASRPRLVESVRGVKVKSCKTQTNLARLPPAPPLSFPQNLSQGQPPHYIYSPSHMTPGDPSDLPTTPVEGFLIPMAIPLGQPRVDGLPPQPSRVLLSDRPVVVTTSLPPSQAKPGPGPATQGPRKPNIAVLEVYSEHKRQPQLQVQVQPSVNIEPPTPSPALSAAAAGTHKRTVEIIERKIEEEEEEENVFPGTDFLAVADIVQDTQEESVLADVEIELDGQPSPPATMYHGPAFPPQPSAPLPAQEQASVLSLIEHRETLENRLVDWVEQQLMARMISEMYRPPPSDPAQNDSTPQSEPEERSAASDIVEGAGGGGIQLFVDASVPVDSDLIRQYVNEALAETVALMLGQREGQGLDRHTQSAQEPPSPPPPLEERLVPTPVPTPAASPCPVLPSREPSPLGTPQPSEQGSLEQTEPPQHSTPAEPDPEPLATPATTPVPSPPPSDQRYLPWGDAELPLAEEQPHSQETQTQPTRPLVMSVAAEEPVLSPPPPLAPSIPSPQPRRSPTPPPPPAPGPESPASPTSSSTDDSSSSSSASSSSTVTAGTDTAVKQISEGELLLSFNQLAAMAAIEEEGLSHYVSSFSSSLHEVQDMDYDPPSEGQVRRPQSLSHHDPVLTLLARMDQGVISHTEPRPQPEGSGEEEEEMSVGEVKEDQRHMLTGHLPPELRDRTTKPHRTTSTSTTGPKATGTHSRVAEDYRSTEASQRQVSPGQLTQSADVTEVSFGVTNQGPVTLGDLEVEPIRTAVVTSDLQTDQSPSPLPLEETHTAAKVVVPEAVRPAPIMVRRYLVRGVDRDTPAGQEEEEEVREATQGGPRKMAVRLPSIGLERRDEERGEEEEDSVSLAGVPDTDSSGNDVF